MLGWSHCFLGIYDSAVLYCDELTCLAQAHTAPRVGIEPLNLESDALPPGAEVIKLFSCSTQLSLKFQFLINTEIVQIY